MIKPDGTAKLPQAVRELRASLGLSQQAMAGKLGLSMGSIRNYESGAITVPDAKGLYAYTLAAETGNRADLAAVFRDALYRELGFQDCAAGRLAIEPKNVFEEILVAALLATLRRGGFAKFRKQVLKALLEPCKALIKGITITFLGQIEFNSTLQNIYPECPARLFLRKQVISK